MPIAWLIERANEWAESIAIAWRGQKATYGWLLDAVCLWRDQLRIASVRHGQVVALNGDYSPQAIALLLALIDNANVIVPLTESVEAHRAEFLEIARAQFVIRFDDTDGWQIDHRDVLGPHPLIESLVQRGEPGLVLFSSGSTGKPKASLHSMTRFLMKFRTSRAALRTVAVPPMDHIAGLDTLFYTLGSGGSLICPSDRRPSSVCELIERHRVELLPASAAFLNLLLISEIYRQFDLSSLRFVAYGSDVMPEHTLARLREILPNSKFLQKYGTTELGSPRTRSRSDDGSLWMRIETDGVETKVVDATLWIRSQSAMLGYLNAPSPFDAEGWMNTEDVVEVDGDFIRVIGRRSEIINVGGHKVYPVEVENILMKMDNILDVTVYGEKNPIMGSVVSARVSVSKPEDPIALKKRIGAFCKDKLAPYKIPVKVQITEESQFTPRYKKVRRQGVGV